jgi:hypothetical protein
MLQLDGAWLLLALSVFLAKKGFTKNNRSDAPIGAQFEKPAHQALTLVFYGGCCLLALVPLGMFPQIQDRTYEDATYPSATFRYQIWLYSFGAGVLVSAAFFGFYASQTGKGQREI